MLGPTIVACCWPTMLRPFAWALIHELIHGAAILGTFFGVFRVHAIPSKVLESNFCF